MNCQCDPAQACMHTAQADVDRVVRLLRGLTLSDPAQRAQLGLAIEHLQRLDLPQRVLRGEFDAEVLARARLIETAQLGADLDDASARLSQDLESD